MSQNSKFIGHSVEDFVEDRDFRDWVIKPNEILNTFWLNYQTVHPEQSDSIKQARKIIQSITFEESKISPNEYKSLLDQLVKYQTRKEKKEPSVVSLFNTWKKIAAILLLPILAIGIYYTINNGSSSLNTQIVKYMVPEGQKSNLVLADGTKVWINSGSTLSIPSNYSLENRKVQLNGEAYFDVVKDKSHPFLVETKTYTVKVYGTNFNVRAYDYLKMSETVLEEGAVSILSNSGKEITIKPGQRFLLSENSQYTISKVETKNYVAWKNNIFKINNERLQDLIVQMEHWYGVDIKVENFEQVKDLRYTLTIKTESMKEMLDLMSVVTPFVYKIDGENVTLKYN